MICYPRLDRSGRPAAQAWRLERMEVPERTGKPERARRPGRPRGSPVPYTRLIHYLRNMVRATLAVALALIIVPLFSSVLIPLIVLAPCLSSAILSGRGIRYGQWRID